MGKREETNHMEEILVFIDRFKKGEGTGKGGGGGGGQRQIKVLNNARGKESVIEGPD